MVNDGTNLQTKVLKMPEELLFSHFPTLNPRQFFRPNMLPFEFENSQNSLKDKKKAMRRIFEKSITDHNREAEKDALILQFERASVDCIRNNCSHDF